ncbi:MAG: hypothetical protein H6633_25050 [Anaerolineales bacterium]|nr:hypothetical protein [Anaerolineales bacterium]
MYQPDTMIKTKSNRCHSRDRNYHFSFLFLLMVGLLMLSSTAETQEPAMGYRHYLPVVLMGSSPPVGHKPSIYGVSTNASNYSNGQIPRYQKFEITFQVDTGAENLQLPFDPAPPPGLESGTGISVDALFTPDDWQTVYAQPAFYYQIFEHESEADNDWIYPSGDFAWKARFAPPATGDWQFKLVVHDAKGIGETGPYSFTVSQSESKGFVRVSQNDPRYFEFENGDLFTGLGYNLTYGWLNWNNPSQNEARLQILNSYGLQLFRTWLTHWGIYSSAWGAWNSPLPERHSEYIPYASLNSQEVRPGTGVSMVLSQNWNPGVFLGFQKNPPAAKRDTTYHVFIHYLIPQELLGPQVEGYSYGLVAKTGGWLTGPGSWPENAHGFTDPGTGTIVSDHAFRSPTNATGEPQWAVLEGEIQITNQDFMPRLYLVLENTISGSEENGGGIVAFIDRVEIREDLGGGQYGPNLVSKPWMAQHLYFDQRQSYAFDRTLEMAEANDIYLKLVVLEKNEWIMNHIDFDGNTIPEDQNCSDKDPANDPPECPGNDWFYGNGRRVTALRWLQQAWWRYLQARWGYSTSIHSWELLNEGDPANETHFILADEFGHYMHQFAPNDHLVTTSFWHSFPGERFWANGDYPHIDYADLHAYATDSEDTAGNSTYYSERYGALQPEGVGKPLIRGETSFSDAVKADKTGVWLHNYIWAGINAGGMYEQYWYGKEHIEQGSSGNDLRLHYLVYANFMADIPLNNGHYQAAEATSSHSDIRVWGQKDLINGCAHLWLQNGQHTWRNVVDSVAIPARTATIELASFQAGKTYTLEWWDPYQPDPAKQIIDTEQVQAQNDSVIVFTVQNLDTDVAVKLISKDRCSINQ